MIDRFHIQVVGVNKRFLSSTLNHLGKLGHFVDGARSVEELLIKCDESQPDLVIMKEDVPNDTKEHIINLLSIKHPSLVVISCLGSDSELNYLIDNALR